MAELLLAHKGGLVWAKDGDEWRRATPEECASEIRRLEKMIADIRYAFDAVFNPGMTK